MFKKGDKVKMYRNNYYVTALAPACHNHKIFQVARDEVKGMWVTVLDDKENRWFIPRSYLKRV